MASVLPEDTWKRAYASIFERKDFPLIALLCAAFLHLFFLFFFLQAMRPVSEHLLGEVGGGGVFRLMPLENRVHPAAPLAPRIPNRIQTHSEKPKTAPPDDPIASLPTEGGGSAAGSGAGDMRVQYPKLSRIFREEGEVHFVVAARASQSADTYRLVKSSGHKRLDSAAQSAMQSLFRRENFWAQNQGKKIRFVFRLKE